METLAYYEVLMLLIPLIALFLAIYFLFRQFFQNQYKLFAMQVQQSGNESTKRVKLQAYERLMLFCERISIQNLLLRLQSSEMSARDLQSALVLAIQQEYEYNLSQQLYVSAALWQIVTLAKNQVIELVSHIGARLPENARAEDLSKQLILYVESQKKNPVGTAKTAIKKEAGLLM